MTQYCFLEPLDVLFLRGNKLFGDPGSYGESLIPPWPSVAAGALRSRILVDDNVSLADFAGGRTSHPILGTPADPGIFTVTAFHLAKRKDDGVETFHALPADLVVIKPENAVQLLRMTPQTPAAGLLSSSPLPKLAVLTQDKRSKPEQGYWLNQEGWRCYLNGELPTKEHLYKTNELWAIDPRVGVGLDAATRCAEEGRLFTTQAVAFKNGVGFLVGVLGVTSLPNFGTVRLGGDGRAAAVRTALEFKPCEPNYEAISQARRCRVVLTSPGVFADGWKPPGLDAELNWRLGDVRAKLVAAAVPRAEVISGWDIAKREPKPADRAVPTGSVYWLEELDATPEALRKLAESGLWASPDDNAARRAEGFNRFTFAAYRTENYRV